MVEEFNQKYFRPSRLPALNIRDLNDLIYKIYDEDPSKVEVPKELMISPINTIINYYSILREATPVTKDIGCGSVGAARSPYPAAYNFLTSNYKSRLSYSEYLKSFNAVSHINLIKIVKGSKTGVYYVELEQISPPGSFEYSFGNMNIIKENGEYKIGSIDMEIEEYFCAPYHLWQHNAELKVDIMYSDWCKLIAVRFPTVRTDFNKYIYIQGTDGKTYLFLFIKLTNGTDVEIGQYMQSSDGKWIPVNIDSKKCLAH